MLKVAEKRAGFPYADSRIAKFLRAQIAALQGVKTQRAIAREAGYDQANIISMFKHGETKVPLDRIPALAKALGVDPAFLFRLAMEQHWGASKAIVSVFGTIVTKNERETVAYIRELTAEEDPELSEKTKKKLLDAFTR